MQFPRGSVDHITEIQAFYTLALTPIRVASLSVFALQN